MESKTALINELLCRKSANKQLVYQITLEVMHAFKEVMQELQAEIAPCLSKQAPTVQIKYYDKGDFEAHLRFSGDTVVVMMHTNIFDFDENHYITNTAYVKEDNLREYCGMIQIYNFLYDSLKYNREHDAGYLVGRVFVNKDKHFFVEGKRPLSFMYSDFEKNIISKEYIRSILEEVILFCLNFDLQVPPLDAINFITLEQKNVMSYSSGMPTQKRLGFRMSSETETDQES